MRMALCGALFCAMRLSADVVETKNGAREVGKITSIHGGVITLETEYAGELKVKQSLVTSITTDRPVAMRLADGSSMVGVVTTVSPSKLQVSNPTKSFDFAVAIVPLWHATIFPPFFVAGAIFSGFAMVVTLVWLYLEILRLLSKLNSRN